MALDGGTDLPSSRMVRLLLPHVDRRIRPGMNQARRFDIPSFARDVVPSILPEQLPGASGLARAEGCYRLLASVLETAIDDCITRARRREGIEAEQWIFAADSTNAPIPFLLVCDMLDLEPHVLRQRIRIWQSLGHRPSRLTDALE
jgi:hypothetical protein